MSYKVGLTVKGRTRRRLRIRKKIFGTSSRPRLSVFRSARHMYAQVIDDVAGKTLASSSTLDKGMREALKGDKSACAKQVGLLLAARCKEKDIATVVFDRNGYLYHGRVQAVAEGAREGGLNF